MSNILGLLGLTTSASPAVENLIAAYSNDFFVYDSSLDTWNGQSVPNTIDKSVYTTAFLDKGFFVNGNNNNVRRYDPTTTTKWTDETARKKAPRANTIKQVGDRIYLGGIYLNGVSYASTVWYTDLPVNNDITYGLEYGTDLKQTAGSTLVTSAGSYFTTRNIKIGDPINITTGANQGRYFVQSIESENRLVLTTAMTSSATNSTFWVGGNYVNVATNDNDIVTAIGDNNGRKLFFKRDSLWRYDDQSLLRIKGVPGTTSQLSVVNLKEHTYYFHRTGIWRTDGVGAQLLSRPVQDYIEGISSDMYINVVAYPVGEKVRFFVGNVVNNDTGINVNNCFIDFDTITESVIPGKLASKITAVTEFVEQNTRNIYVGDENGRVYQENKGNNDDGTAIPWMMETGFVFPLSPSIELEFDKFIFHIKNGRNIQALYKLYGTPFKIDKQWKGMCDISDEVTELIWKGRTEADNTGRGINIKLIHSGNDKPPTVERIDIFYRPATTRSL